MDELEKAYVCTPPLLRIGTLFLTELSIEDSKDEGYIHNTAQFLYRGYGLSETLKLLDSLLLEKRWLDTSELSFDENMEHALDCVSIYNDWRELGIIKDSVHKKALLKATYEIQSALVKE